MARHQVIFVHAWPGTGKSSQVPRILHAAGHGPVVCSQTYRIAAESAADMRSGEVACLTDRTPASPAPVTYTTHHALLRELPGDPLLSNYGAVVVDEADDGMLLTAAVLSRIKAAAARRSGLRVVVCSHGTKFNGDDEAVRRLFPGALDLWFRTKIGLCLSHFVTKPVTDYLTAAVDMVCHVHATEPPGDVLVFLPHCADVEAAERLLVSRSLPGVVTRCLHDGVPVDVVIGDVLRPTLDGERKVVLATDVADSAVFVDGIKYIVDSGYRCADNAPPSMVMTKASSLSPPARLVRGERKDSVVFGYHMKGWENRGKCFCLYTFDEAQEMLRTGCSPLRTNTDDVDRLAAVVLVLKDLGIARGHAVESFDFVLAPRPETFDRALAALVEAGALGLDGEVTEEGTSMARDILERCYF